MTWVEDAGSVNVVSLPPPAHAGQHHLWECFSAAESGAVITRQSLHLWITLTLCNVMITNAKLFDLILTWKSGLWLGQVWHDHWGQQGASTHCTSWLWRHSDPWGHTRSQASGPHWPGYRALYDLNPPACVTWILRSCQCEYHLKTNPKQCNHVDFLVQGLTLLNVSKKYSLN